MQPKDFINCLNSSTPIDQKYTNMFYKTINTRVNLEIPTLKTGLPHLPTSAENARGLVNLFRRILFNYTATTLNLNYYVESKYVLVPNYFYISRGFLFSSMNGIITPLVLFVRNKRTKEIGLYINDEALSSSTNYSVFYKFIKKYRIDWVLAGYPIVTKQEVDKLFVSPTIPTFRTIKEAKSWEDKIKESIYAEAI